LLQQEPSGQQAAPDAQQSAFFADLVVAAVQQGPSGQHVPSGQQTVAFAWVAAQQAPSTQHGEPGKQQSEPGKQQELVLELENTPAHAAAVRDRATTNTRPRNSLIRMGYLQWKRVWVRTIHEHTGSTEALTPPGTASLADRLT
jgi:hypothetical protein